jgi:RNA polymerase sigma factor (sigma-70 family)
METPSPGDYLSAMVTSWTVVREAHSGVTDQAASARGRLLLHYGGAAYRYLLGALRDRDAADDVFQEFALRLLRGDFRRADSRRGRFRDFIKTALFHLVVDHQRRRRGTVSLPPDEIGPAAEVPPTSEAEREFLRGWRDEMLGRTWEALDRAERRTGQPFYTTLRFRAEHPEMRSPELAERLGGRWHRQISSEAVRQLLHRARVLFADLLLAEVAMTLERPDREGLEQELIDLELIGYCRPALERLDRIGPSPWASGGPQNHAE